MAEISLDTKALCVDLLEESIRGARINYHLYRTQAELPLELRYVELSDLEIREAIEELELSIDRLTKALEEVMG